MSEDDENDKQGFETWIDAAEALGMLEIFPPEGRTIRYCTLAAETSFVKVKVRGQGDTIEEACRFAVKRAREFGDKWPKHTDGTWD